MSTVVEASPRPAADETSPLRPARPSLADAIVVVVLAAALVAIPFITGGGVDQSVASSGNTWIEIALSALGALAVTAALTRSPPARGRAGLLVLLWFGAFVVLSGVSIAWSAAPDSSWLAEGQLVAYLLVFAGAIAAARLAPGGWRALLGGLVLAAAALCLWSLAAKVFPGTLASYADRQYGRLLAPFGYWNALAIVAAMAVPACLWLGVRRDGGRVLAGLAAPALTLALTVLVLSYSRSADLAAIVGGGLWLIAVPLRLRAAALLGVAGAGAAVISGWGLSHSDLTTDKLALATQTHAGHPFGVVILVVLVLVTAGGLALARAMDRVSLAAPARRRIGTALLGLVGLVVIVAIVGLALSSRGLSGQISHGWTELTNPAAVSADNPGRVLQFGSSRPVYWHEALDVGRHDLFKGVGLNGFSIARLRFATTNPEPVFSAHSYVFQTFADLGVLGLAVTAALLGAWLLAGARTLELIGRGRSGRDPGSPVAGVADLAAERIGMITLATLVVAFGVQSTLDWTWSFAGCAVPALLAAGWLAGRGPLSDRRMAARTAGAGAPAARTGSVLDRPVALVGSIVLCALVGLAGWMVWRPLRSAQLINHAELTSSTAQRFADARSAHSQDPIALEPLTLLSILYGDAHRPATARAQLVRGTQVQPRNPQAWTQLLQFEIAHRQWSAAIGPLHELQLLDRTPAGQASTAAEIRRVFSHIPGS